MAGIATFYHGAPDRLCPEQIRASLHHLLVERPLAWSACHQVACGLKCFSTRPLGWTTVHLDLPPRTGRPPCPGVLSLEARERLGTRARTLTHRAFRMPPCAAGRRVRAVVRLPLTDRERARRLRRVTQGKGHQERATLLAPRLRSALRPSWPRYRPSPGRCTAQTPTTPMAIATAQQSSSHTQRAAGSTHGKGIQTLRHSCATHLLEAGVDGRTLQLLHDGETSRAAHPVPLSHSKVRHDIVVCRTTPLGGHAAQCPPVGVRGTRLTPVAIVTAPRVRRGRRSSGSRPVQLRSCLCPLSTWCVPCHTTSTPSSSPTSGPC